MADYISKYASGEAVDAALDLAMNSVQQVEGKGLSTEDFTTEEKTQIVTNTNNIADVVDELANAKGAYTTLGERLSGIESEEESIKSDVIAETERAKTTEASLKSDVAINRQTLGYMKKNLLKVTATSQTINGVTFTVNSDGSVTADGTATANCEFNIPIPLEHAGQNLRLTGCPTGGATANSFRILARVVSPSQYAQNLGSDIGNGVTINIPNEATSVVARINVFEGYTANNLTFHPMLRSAGIKDDTFEPYVADVDERLVQLTDTITALIVRIEALENGT